MRAKSMPKARQIVAMKDFTSVGSLSAEWPLAPGLAVSLAAQNTAARQHRGEHIGPMISACLRVNSGRAAELTGPDDERRIQHATCSQIFHERGPADIEYLAHSSGSIKIILMRVPTGVSRLSAAHRDFDERDAAFDETAGQQTALAKLRSAIPVAQPARFVIQLEGGRRLQRHQRTARS